MEELLRQTGYKLWGLKKGQFVKGKVIFLSPQTVLFDIGGKSEAILASKEREEVAPFLAQLKEGDEVEVLVLLPENENGQPVVSLRRTAADFKWKKAEELQRTQEVVVVRALETNRGGLLVDFLGLRGFLPSAQLSLSHVGKEESLVGKELQVKVVEVDRLRNRLVFSEKRVLSPEEEKRRRNLWQKIRVGERVEGEVTAILPFGVFVDVGGLEGLIHISEIAWEKVEDPGNYFQKGERVRALVIEKDRESGQLQLSVKQLTPDPWKEVAERYKEGQAVKGRVVKKEVYGVFVRLREGLDALLHVSKIPPEVEIGIGEEIECVIEKIDVENRRISLTLLPKRKPVGYK